MNLIKGVGLILSDNPLFNTLSQHFGLHSGFGLRVEHSAAHTASRHNLAAT
jgi:hypothetical protein